MLPRHPEGLDLRVKRLSVLIECVPWIPVRAVIIRVQPVGNGVQRMIACAALCRRAGERLLLVPASRRRPKAAPVTVPFVLVLLGVTRIIAARGRKSERKNFSHVTTRPVDGGVEFFVKNV